MNHNSQDKQKLLKLLLQKKGIGVKINTIPSRNPSQLIPLSFSQERLGFLYQLEANGYTYNMAFRFQIEGNSDIDIFRKALETIMQRHRLLRTCFQEVDEIPRQIIKPKIQLNLPLLDLIQELSHLYEAFVQKQSNPLPNFPIQYGDFAVWQRQQLF
ncbi:MAG: condensation domain-containing protein [Microcystis aeruginosa]